jgi:hypothetical protein
MADEHLLPKTFLNPIGSWNFYGWGYVHDFGDKNSLRMDTVYLDPAEFQL